MTDATGKYPLWKKALLIPVVAIGVGLFIFMVKSRQTPKRLPPTERATAVRVIQARSMSVVPRAIGYGYIKPAQVWNAVAEVPGRAVDVHPDFNRGAIVHAGEVLLVIDPAETGLVREQYEAETERIQAELRKLSQSEKDIKRQISVEEGQLKLVEKELDRNRQLVKQGVMAQSELDAQERSYLAQRNIMQNYESSLNAIPSERAALRAQLAAARTRTATARLDEEKTVIRVPFNSRIVEDNVEVGQAVTVNQVLAKLDSLDTVEAFAQFPFHSFSNLVMPDSLQTANGANVKDYVSRFLGMDAVVRVNRADGVEEWPGKLIRVADAVDMATRTIGVFVAVDHAAGRGEAAHSLLIKNMYGEVELLGQPQGPYVVIPRSAVHKKTVYVADKENRLELRPVEIAYYQLDMAIIFSGLNEGETVVVSSVVPAIEGMLLKPEKDESLEQRLLREAERDRSGS